MNEKIKQLAEQHGLIHAHQTPSEQHDLLKRYEKFLTIVINECVDVVSNGSTEVHPLDLGILLKQHFGVE